MAWPRPGPPGWTLDSIAQTVMEKIAEYFRPDNWSLLTVDEQRSELMYLVKKTTRDNSAPTWSSQYLISGFVPLDLCAAKLPSPEGLGGV